MWFALRKLRSYWLGRYEGWSLARKHADLAYLTPNQFPNELNGRYREAYQAVLKRYEKRRSRLEEDLAAVQHERKALEEVVGDKPPSPAVFHQNALARWGGIGLVFVGELFFNKLGLDTMEVSQLEAYILGFTLTLVMFIMGHTAGNQFRKGHKILAIALLALPALLVLALSVLRYNFNAMTAQIRGDPAPSLWTLVFLVLAGLLLIAFTFALGYFSPHDEEILQARLFRARRRERLLWRRLEALQHLTQRRLEGVQAHYSQEVAAYWRGFARAWPRFDPVPEFLGHIPTLEAVRPRPLPQPEA